jgi:hypothetical protein
MRTVREEFSCFAHRDTLEHLLLILPDPSLVNYLRAKGYLHLS